MKTENTRKQATVEELSTKLRTLKIFYYVVCGVLILTSLFHVKNNLNQAKNSRQMQENFNQLYDLYQQQVANNSVVQR